MVRVWRWNAGERTEFMSFGGMRVVRVGSVTAVVGRCINKMVLVITISICETSMPMST